MNNRKQWLLLLVSLSTQTYILGEDPKSTKPNEPPIPILSHAESMDLNGNYNYSYVTGNGIQVSQQGMFEHPGTKNETKILTVSGSYRYTAPDGTLVNITYKADQNGYIPQGDGIIPKSAENQHHHHHGPHNATTINNQHSTTPKPIVNNTQA